MSGAENGDDVVKPADAAAAEEEDEDTMLGRGPAPRTRPKRPLQFEHAYLDSLPCAHMYEKSYMHHDVVTHVAVAAAEFFISGSSDGHIKFWKKKAIGIEFSKHFRSHLGPIEGLAKCRLVLILCCTISNDQSEKVYDVVNCDMMVIMRLPFFPGAVEWIYKQGDVKVHLSPINVMKYNAVADVVVSADDKGIIEYWCPATSVSDGQGRF